MRTVKEKNTAQEVRSLWVARTIADLGGRTDIMSIDVVQSMNYLDRQRIEA